MGLASYRIGFLFTKNASMYTSDEIHTSSIEYKRGLSYDLEGRYLEREAYRRGGLNGLWAQ